VHWTSHDHRDILARMRGLLLLCAVGLAYPARGAYADTLDLERVASARGDLERAKRLDDLECTQLLAPIVWQLTALRDGDLEEAIQRTFDRCSAALDQRYERFKPGGCRLKIAGALSTTAAPAALRPKGAKAACLALVPGPPRKAALEGHKRNVCARVALVWSARGLKRRELTFDGGPLADESWCCNLDTIAAGTLHGHTVVRVTGSGHPCDGGTAVEGSDAFYQWNGKALVSPTDISIDFH